jgi:hypothetical protein
VIGTDGKHQILGGWPVQHNAFGAAIESGGDLQTATDGIKITSEQVDCGDSPVRVIGNNSPLIC